MMNGRMVAAIVGSLVILALLLWACRAVRRRRATRRPELVGPVMPVPMPPPYRNPSDDVRLLETLFAGWTKYIWGPTYAAPVAVAYVQQDGQARWHVFVTSRAQPLAAAYVTLPHEPDPLAALEVAWQYTSYPDSTAHALNNITPDSYSRMPVLLHTDSRPPEGRPSVIQIRRGSA
jgi:hypothetical protein